MLTMLAGQSHLVDFTSKPATLQKTAWPRVSRWLATLRSGGSNQGLRTPPETPKLAESTGFLEFGIAFFGSGAQPPFLRGTLRRRGDVCGLPVHGGGG